MFYMSANAQTWTAFLSATPASARQPIEIAIGSDPPPVFDFLLGAVEGSPKPGPLALTLLDSGALVRAISDPSLLSLPQAIQLARAAARLDEALDHKILSDITSPAHNWPHDLHRQQTMRVLQVIDAISDCRRLVIPLMKFLKLPHRHLRSKAVKLLARACHNATWADSVLNDADPRVRSNLVEGLAAGLGNNAIPLLKKAANDPHHRVAVTALLALARLGEADSRALLEKLAAQDHPERKRAAAWALERLAQDAVSPSSEVPHRTA